MSNTNFNMATDPRDSNQLLNRANIKKLANHIEATTGPLSTQWSEYHELNILVDYACEISGKSDQISPNIYGKYNAFTLACEYIGLNWCAGQTLFTEHWDDDWLREGEFSNQPLTMHPLRYPSARAIWSTVPAEKKIMPYVLRRLARLGWDRNEHDRGRPGNFLGGWLIKDGMMEQDEFGFLVWRWHKDLQEGETTVNLMMEQNREQRKQRDRELNERERAEQDTPQRVP